VSRAHTRILQRSTRHVALTPVGARVADQARRILDEVRHLQRLAEESRTELRVGYAWAVLGKHTRRLQKRWAAAHPDLPLRFVQVNEPTAGLADGTADVAVIRRPLTDARFATAQVGLEARYAAVATDNALARRRSVRLSDLARYPVAIDARTGTTTPDLFPPDSPPASIRWTHSVDEWLTHIALGQAVGITSEATAHQNPRPGIAYRALRGLPPIRVQLAWWKDDPPAHLPDLLDMVRAAFRPPER
jgi:DNA-binding transcriptional LysR family regulator